VQGSLKLRIARRVPPSIVCATFLVALLLAVAAGATDGGRPLSAASPAVRVGDRLFFDTRFAQFFFAHSHGDMNAKLAAGDPVIDQMPFTATQSLTSPFRGQSMSCRQCHLGDDFLLEEPLAGRTYCDFSRRTPIPRRDDGLTTTPRNSPLMVNVGLPREVPTLLHFDGEFATAEDLVIDTLTGRNFGWLPGERPAAVAHVANVIRKDEGTNPRQVTYAHGGGGVPYRVVLLGTDPKLPSGLQLSHEYRIDVATASDEEIVHAVAKLIRAYMNSLRFGTTNTGRRSPSPYDVFLAKNGLPAAPANGQSGRAYAEQLRAQIDARKQPTWVTPDDAEFELHEQPFRFGAEELRGLKLFFAQSSSRGASAAADGTRAGNCVACHPPPQFTDYRLHNNGVSQAEYDRIFGDRAFAALDVPDLRVRDGDFDAYLPPSPAHPHATSRFRVAPSKTRPGSADLGVWNVLANPDMPKPQAAITGILCEQLALASNDCTAGRLLPLSIAYFKTPSIRDLGQSYPYFHSGAMDTIEDVLHHYVATAELVRAGKVRNASPELAAVRIDAGDVAPLAAFLRALNEDYR
jgi:cytochrome c peroxidase